jgi:uncharacterized protein YbbK (DUF523 family)
VNDHGTPCQTASATPVSAEELEKQRRKQNRAKFIKGIRDSLDSVTHQMALTPTQAAIACSRSPTWGYRRVYDGTFKVIDDEDGRLLIPRSEIERYLGSAEKYNPEPKAKGGDENGRS